MVFPRITAAACVLLLIGSLSLFCIALLAYSTPSYLQGQHAEMVGGKIVAIESGRDFMLETTSGKDLYFHCDSLCHASLAHLWRHLREHATTDVYYKEGPQHSLLALDVD